MREAKAEHVQSRVKCVYKLDLILSMCVILRWKVLIVDIVMICAIKYGLAQRNACIDVLVVIMCNNHKIKDQDLSIAGLIFEGRRDLLLL